MFHHLLRARKQRAIDVNCAPFEVATTQVLLNFTYCRPTNDHFLRNNCGMFVSIVIMKTYQFNLYIGLFNLFLSGVRFSDRYINGHGHFWVAVIQEFCSENGLETNRPMVTAQRNRKLPRWMQQDSKETQPFTATPPLKRTRADVIRKMNNESLFKL